MSKPEPWYRQITVQVIIGVLVTMIAGWVLGLGPYLSSLFWWLWERLVAFVHYLGDDAAVVRWWYWLLCLIFVGVCLRAAWVCWKAFRKTPDPDYYAFSEMDHMFVHWKWRWIDDQPKGIWCYCRCGREMTYHEDVLYSEVTFACTQQGRGHDQKEFKGNRSRILGLVCHEIEHQVQCGGWRQKVAQQPQISPTHNS